VSRGRFGGALMGQDGAGHKVQARIDWLSLWTAEGRRAILWLPVLMGGGIWLYLALARKPDPVWCALTTLPLAALLSGAAWRAGLAALALALTAFGGGFSLAVLAAHRAAAPMLSAPTEKTVRAAFGPCPRPPPARRGCCSTGW